jgi:hypothetical protein
MIMTDRQVVPADAHRQCAKAVVMVRPATFYSNPETLETNQFQHAVRASAAETLLAAQAEFDQAVDRLMQAGIEVMVMAADPLADTPDAVFPNNWFSTHADGRLLLYPMSTPNRRRERRPEALQTLLSANGYAVESVLDFSTLEQVDCLVEGTGSLVFDRRASRVYASLSARTHPEGVTSVAKALGYEAVIFQAHDVHGRRVYHTNVIMAVGDSVAFLADGLIQDRAERTRVMDALRASGKAVLSLSAAQVDEFAGNALFLDSPTQGPCVALSERAFESLQGQQRQWLQRHANPLLVQVPTIERLGGGGIRCMLAEIFLPKVASAPVALP